MQGVPIPTTKLLKIDYLADDTVYPCNSAVQVNSIVYFDGSAILQRCSNNNAATLPVIGIVKAKISDTSCQLQFIGERNGFSGIVPNTIYYLGVNGAVTATPPSTAGTSIVPIGIGKNTATIELRLSLQMTNN